jgi:hypothetical protein
MRPPVIARYLLGLILLVFGLNGFLNFLPMPPMPEAAGAFMGALVSSGYLMMLVKATEVLVGVALLANRYVPLALVVLMPISINIVLFHAFLAPAGIAPAALVFVLNAFLMYAYRGYYQPLKTTVAEPKATL